MERLFQIAPEVQCKDSSEYVQLLGAERAKTADLHKGFSCVDILFEKRWYCKKNLLRKFSQEKNIGRTQEECLISIRVVRF